MTSTARAHCTNVKLGLATRQGTVPAGHVVRTYIRTLYIVVCILENGHQTSQDSM